MPAPSSSSAARWHSRDRRRLAVPLSQDVFSSSAKFNTSVECPASNSACVDKTTGSEGNAWVLSGNRWNAQEPNDVYCRGLEIVSNCAGSQF